MATMFMSVAYAASSQEEYDKINSNQAVTQQSPEEISAAAEKAKDAEEVLKAIENYKAKKATENAPSASTLLGYAYLDTVCSEGDIYDTHMSGSNQLYGYAQNSERYHYVAGDGYDNINSQVHYLDPNNLSGSWK
ncbi:MAG: hypothetical protein QHH06_01275 [Clostridiales bacterium]|jgi:hypothetical protein|nr:hypothetical protein [Eubacteriales bacterium]MDH7565099.1 hypothetical protein [Clostridiales bacterium]